VAFPFVFLGFVFLAFVLVMRRRRSSLPAGWPIGDTAERRPEAGIDVLTGYDEAHEAELEAQHGATLHITEDRLSVRQV
jgi:hypothetical protein